MSMIIQSLLDQKNSICLKDQTVGSLLQQKKLAHLWDERPCAIDTVVLHAMSASEISPKKPYDMQELFEIFITYEVSAHYLILRDGTIHQLVPDSFRAWHSGPSQMPAPDNRTKVNDFSIGIEIVGKVDEAFTEEQYLSLEEVVILLEKRHHIKNYVGHETIAGSVSVSNNIREVPKWDPGPYFQWHRIPAIKSKRLSHHNE